MKISLLDFLRTGALGPVRLGMPDAQVRQELGEPGGESLRKAEAPWIPYFCKYGDIELYYEQERESLVSIHVETCDVPESTTQIVLDPWIIRRGIPIKEVEGALRTASIPFVRRLHRANANLALLVTDSGVAIGFYLVQEQYTVPAGLNFVIKSELGTSE